MRNPTASLWASFSLLTAVAGMRSHVVTFAPAMNRMCPSITSRRTASMSGMPEGESIGTKVDDLLIYTGRFYFAAGLAHAVDFATGNKLLSSAGLGSFSELPALGQALGVVWVLIGLAQPLGRTRAQRQAGVVAYGGWELLLALAGFLVTADPSGELAWLQTAAAGQLVLGIAYLLLRSLSLSEKNEPARDHI